MAEDGNSGKKIAEQMLLLLFSLHTKSILVTS